jgi:hypothetical protein
VTDQQRIERVIEGVLAKHRPSATRFCIGCDYTNPGAESITVDPDHFPAVLAAELLAARTITTVEQLDALPEGTLIQPEHRPLVYAQRGGKYRWRSLMDGFDRESRVLPLPMLVLWHPEDRP